MDGLTKVLEFAEENLAEGEYLKVAKSLKEAYEAKDPEVFIHNKFDFLIRISCVEEDSTLELTHLDVKIMKGAFPTKYELSYAYINAKNHRSEKTLKWEDCFTPTVSVLIRKFLTLCNSQNVVMWYDDMIVKYDFQETLTKAKNEKNVIREVEEIDDDDDSDFVDSETYWSVIGNRAAEIVDWIRRV